MSPVLAHMAIEGAGEIANGAAHPFVTPAHVLLLLGLGLLAGQRSPLDLMPLLRVFLPLSAAALGLTAARSFGTPWPPLLVALALGLGAAVGLEWKMPRSVFAAVCAAVAIVIGLDSGVESGTGMAVAKTLLGTWLAANAAVFYIAVCASNGAEKQWARTAVRILGSWIVAISLMVLAFALRKN